MKAINMTKEFNIGPNSVYYEKYKPIFDFFPAEIAEMILNQIPEEEKIILSGDMKEDYEDPDYDLPDYEEDFELFGNQAIESDDEDDYDEY